MHSVTGEEVEMEAGGIFFAVGHDPATSLFEGNVELDKDGYVVVDRGARTSIPGLFGAGDCADKIYRQAITAAGTGCVAALELERWLEERG